jgi:predicted phage terminase large subunit-like protein
VILDPLDDRVGADREWIRRKGFAGFVREAWRLVDPHALTWGWHLDAMCEHLTALHKREIRDLVINVPPGMSKSITASVLYPAWVWGPGNDPSHRWIMASYSERLLLRDARKMRTLVNGRWYRDRWPGVRIPEDRTASTAAGVYFTTAGGMRYSATVRGSVTGDHADTVGVDDPIDPQGAAASSGTELDAVLEWWTGTMPSRYRDHATSGRFLIMQRVHERDLTTEFKRAGATVLCLPMRFERAHPSRYPRDPRTAEGELLCPARVPEAEVVRLETTLGPTRAAAQLQQRPAPAGGGTFKGSWFKRWTELPPGGTWCLSDDCTFKVTTDGSYVVLQVWYQQGANFYLVDQRRERLSFTGTVSALVAMRAAYPKAHKTLVEDKANGSAVVDALKRDVPGLVLVEPEGGKEARANAIQGLVAGGNVFVPHETDAVYPDGRRGAPWVAGFIAECEAFPRAMHDDQVDSMTQFLNHAAPRLAQRFAAAMAAIRKG